MVRVYGINKINLLGLKDIDLCDDGIIEAKKCAKIIKLKGINIDHCFTSDLIRTVNTASIIKNELYENV